MKKFLYLGLTAFILCGSASMTPCSAAEFVASKDNISTLRVGVSSYGFKVFQRTSEKQFDLKPGKTNTVDLTELINKLKESRGRRLTVSVLPAGEFGPAATCYNDIITSQTNIDEINKKIYTVSIKEGPGGEDIKCQAEPM